MSLAILPRARRPVSVGRADCPVQPLYATNDDGSSVSQKLAEVSVSQQSTRVGQLVRNEIVRSTRPVGTEAPDRYYLKLQAKGDAETLIDTEDTVHRRLAYNLTTDPNEMPAIWCLFSIAILLIGLSPYCRRVVTA